MMFRTSPGGSHPLDMIPLLRRWPASPLRNVLYTGLWNTVVTLFLSIMNWFVNNPVHGLMNYVVPVWLISNIVGYTIHGTLIGLGGLLRGWPSRARGATAVLYHVVVITLSVIFATSFGLALLRGVPPLEFFKHVKIMTPILPIALFMAMFMVLLLMAGERRIRSEMQALRQGEQIAAAAQLLAEARLRALQAQIEPHFLYNTLANVLSLIDNQPAQARHMLERFIDYLRASLTASRAEHSTLGAELDLAAAYLDVLAVRMGERLRYRIEVADAVRAIRMAPMLLQPIVENAVMHGLEPKVDGGEIVLRAHADAATVHIEVADTGVGLSAASPRAGGGVGLANLRARLRSLYGGGAQVQLLENQPCGMLVRVLLPLEMVSPSNKSQP